MVENKQRRATCGGCVFFRTVNAEGRPYGVNETSGLQEGVCRTNRGLVFGVRQADRHCLQPAGIARTRMVVAADTSQDRAIPLR